VELLGWSYPRDQDLFSRISRALVYPVTTLTGLSRAEKKILIEGGTISVNEIIDDRRRLDPLHLSLERVGEIRAEIEGLLSLPEVSRDMVYV
jgi:hypothetical protein